MFEIFQSEKIISVLMGLFLALGILLRLTLGFLYQRLIKEADNMSATENKQLKQCKLKFAHCFQLNRGVSNIPVFVDKFLNRLSLGNITFDFLYHASGQLVLLSVVCAGVGVCKSIVLGRSFAQIMPFYIVSFLGIYLFFSVSAIVDVRGKRRILKVNLVDYLENHLSSRIGVTDRDIKMLYGKDLTPSAEPGKPKKPEKRSKEQPAFTQEQEKELEELLLDFLT